MVVRKLFLLISFSVALLSFCPTTLAQTTFTNITKEAGLQGAPTEASPVRGDYDNDGDLDLYIAYSNWGWWNMGPDAFYRNNGDGTFTDVTAEAGLDKNKGACSHAGFLDYDNDGYLDLYVYNPAWNGAFDNRLAIYRNTGDGKFTDVTIANLQEAVHLHLEGEDPAEYGLVTNPTILVMMELETAASVA